MFYSYYVYERSDSLPVHPAQGALYFRFNVPQVDCIYLFAWRHRFTWHRLGHIQWIIRRLDDVIVFVVTIDLSAIFVIGCVIVSCAAAATAYHVIDCFCQIDVVDVTGTWSLTAWPWPWPDGQTARHEDKCRAQEEYGCHGDEHSERCFDGKSSKRFEKLSYWYHHAIV